MRFLANETFPRASIRRLREAGYEVEAVQEKEPGAKDPAVLDYAARENLVLLTFDRDYGELIYRRHMPSPRGVLYLRLIPLTPEDPAEVILDLLQVIRLKLEDRYTVAERHQIRQRSLP